jgi:hypothetical protein
VADGARLHLLPLGVFAMAIENEPHVLAADVLSEIIMDIKSSRPTTSTGESTTGFVFSMQVPGFMVSPKDFSRPWSPIGGAPAEGPPPHA